MSTMKYFVLFFIFVHNGFKIFFFSYYKVNKVRQFQNSRPFHKGKREDNEFKVIALSFFIDRPSFMKM